jgi:hypothetical protein
MNFQLSTFDCYSTDIDNQYPLYCISNEEKIIKNKLNQLINYCEFVIDKDEFQEKLCLDDIEMEYHVNFIIDKMYYILYILEKLIEKELRKEYKMYEFILNDNTVEQMINIYIHKDIHCQDSRNMLNKLQGVIDIINVNKLFKQKSN